MNEKISRRSALKLSAAALGSVTLGPGAAQAAWSETNPPPGLTDKNTFFTSLPTFEPGEPLAANEMRLSSMGTSPLLRRSQLASSIFVELGNGESFIFDIGTGTTVNYVAMKVQASKIRKVFLTHLHGDHTNDLTSLYCFGAQYDGKSPLYIWGPSRSGIRNPYFQHPDYPDEPEYFDDGTLSFARHFREMNRWHTESQNFVQTRFKDAEGDGYDICAAELNWAWNLNSPQRASPQRAFWSNNATLRAKAESLPGFSAEPGVAYYDKSKGVKISFFPAVHDRNGSISYKLEWNGLSMIFSGDTKPNGFMIDNATNGQKGVDVLIHEMVVPPEVWSVLGGGSADPNSAGVAGARLVQENSHTPQKALGYILNETLKRNKAPRLAVATHFQATDSTIRPALAAIRSWYPGPVSIATDLMVINVSSTQIHQRRAVVSDYATNPVNLSQIARGLLKPKYKDLSPTNPYYPSAPLAQFDRSLQERVIYACNYDPSDFACTHPYNRYNGPGGLPGK